MRFLRASIVGLGELVVAGGSGGLLVLAFAPTDLWPLAFLSLAPWLAQLSPVPRKAALTGVIAGLAFFVGGLWWIAWPAFHYAGLSAAAGLPVGLLLMLALAGYLSLYVAGFAAALAWLRPRSGPGFILAAGGLWVALEYLRTYLLSGFPWNLLGYSQYQTFLLLPLASVTGVYGLSFVVVSVNAAIAWTLRQWGAWPAIAWGWVTVGLILVLAVGLGWSAEGPPPTGTPVEVAVIQGNIAQDLKWDAARIAETIAIYRRLTQVAAVERRPGLIVWPETAMPFSLEANARRLEVLGIARSLETPLVIGAPHREAGSGRVHNSAFVVNAAGEVTARYDKRHLVPFGEYLPLRRLLFFADWFVSGGIGEFTPGTRSNVLPSPIGRLAVTICYEAIFPAEVRWAFAEGADLLVNITNDAWFGPTSAPYQHLAMAVLRAVENGTYVVRAANTGISAIIAPDGRILRASRLSTTEIVPGVVRPRSRTTTYTRYGDWFALASAVAVAGALVGVALSHRPAWMRG